jgi:hypothetical protein
MLFLFALIIILIFLNIYRYTPKKVMETVENAVSDYDTDSDTDTDSDGEYYCNVMMIANVPDIESHLMNVTLQHIPHAICGHLIGDDVENENDHDIFLTINGASIKFTKMRKHVGPKNQYNILYIRSKCYGKIRLKYDLCNWVSGNVKGMDLLTSVFLSDYKSDTWCDETLFKTMKGLFVISSHNIDSRISEELEENFKTRVSGDTPGAVTTERLNGNQWTAFSSDLMIDTIKLEKSYSFLQFILKSDEHL